MQNHNFTRTHTRAALFTLVSAPTPSADGALTRADELIFLFATKIIINFVVCVSKITALSVKHVFVSFIPNAKLKLDQAITYVDIKI